VHTWRPGSKADEVDLEASRAKLKSGPLRAPGKPFSFAERQQGYEACIAVCPEVVNLRLHASNHQMRALGAHFPAFMTHVPRDPCVDVNSFRERFRRK